MGARPARRARCLSVFDIPSFITITDAGLVFACSHIPYPHTRPSGSLRAHQSPLELSNEVTFIMPSGRDTQKCIGFVIVRTLLSFHAILSLCSPRRADVGGRLLLLVVL